jgi:hypothetical protein
MADEAFDLATTYVHLGQGAQAVALPGFQWTRDYMMTYLTTFASDGIRGRLVGITPATETWTHWERHTEGDEIVVQLSGRSDVVQEVDGGYRTLSLAPGMAVINRRGVWHTSDVHEPGQTLFVVSGRRTEYRPRERNPR